MPCDKAGWKVRRHRRCDLGDWRVRDGGPEGGAGRGVGKGSWGREKGGDGQGWVGGRTLQIRQTAQSHSGPKIKPQNLPN